MTMESGIPVEKYKYEGHFKKNFSKSSHIVNGGRWRKEAKWKEIQKNPVATSVTG